MLSVKANPVCPDEAAAEKAVNEVWESCFKDTRPFDEVGFLPSLPRSLARTDTDLDILRT